MNPLQLLRSSERPWVVGHRGAAANFPENTLPAFEEAIACGADAVECDVHVSRDGHPVICHDRTLDRTFPSLGGAVADHDSAALGEVGLPTLDAFLGLVKGRIVPIIEIKGGEAVVELTLASLWVAGMLEQAVLFSFHEEYLREIREKAPEATTVWLQNDPLEWPDKVGAQAVGMPYRCATEETVERYRSKDIPVFAWTVPPGPEVDRLSRLGVDAIITDHPRQVLQQLISAERLDQPSNC